MTGDPRHANPAPLLHCSEYARGGLLPMGQMTLQLHETGIPQMHEGRIGRPPVVGDECSGDTPGMDILRVLVADDHHSFASAVAALLDAQPDIEVVAAVATSLDAQVAASRSRPDVAVLDVDLGDGSGIELASLLRDLYPSIQVVVVTGHNQVAVAAAAVRAGVAGFVPKDAPVEDLLTAIRGTARGETHIPPRLLTGVLEGLKAPPAVSLEEQLIAQLTDREKEILDCMMEGLDRASISERLFRSVNTVRTHTRNVLAKLGAHSSIEAVALARRAEAARANRTDGRPVLFDPANVVTPFTLPAGVHVPTFRHLDDVALVAGA